MTHEQGIALGKGRFQPLLVNYFVSSIVSQSSVTPGGRNTLSVSFICKSMIVAGSKVVLSGEFVRELMREFVGQLLGTSLAGTLDRSWHGYASSFMPPTYILAYVLTDLRAPLSFGLWGFEFLHFIFLAFHLTVSTCVRACAPHHLLTAPFLRMHAVSNPLPLLLFAVSDTGLESLHNTPTQTGPVNLLGNYAHMFNATLLTIQGLLTLTLRHDLHPSTLSSVAFTVINPVEVQETQLTFLRVVGPFADTLAEQTGDVSVHTHSYLHMCICMHRNTCDLTRIATYTQSYLDTSSKLTLLHSCTLFHSLTLSHT